MSQLYIARKGTKMTIIAQEDGEKMRFSFMGKTVRIPKEKFLQRWRPAICEERPTA